MVAHPWGLGSGSLWGLWDSPSSLQTLAPLRLLGVWPQAERLLSVCQASVGLVSAEVLGCHHKLADGDRALQVPLSSRLTDPGSNTNRTGVASSFTYLAVNDIPARTSLGRIICRMRVRNRGKILVL